MVHFVQEDEENLLLSPRDFISLRDAGVAGGAFAMRELDQNHVETLVHSDATTWPPVQVTLATCGYIIIDGYHRWTAAQLKRLKAIRASSKTYHSEQEVVEAAFRANLQHGLKASAQTRGDYAYWLHLSYPTMGQIEIARRVGISQAMVSKAIAKREAEARCAEAVEEMTPEAQSRRIKKSCRRFMQVAVQFLNEVEALSDQELVELFKAVMRKSEDREQLVRIGQVLGGEARVNADS